MALVLLAQLADLAGLQRIGIEDRRGADLQRHPQRDRVAETVEERQDAQQPIARLRCRWPGSSIRRWRRCCACVSITPLGSPVEPLEKMMVARRRRLGCDRLVAAPHEQLFLDEAGDQQDAEEGRGFVPICRSPCGNLRGRSARRRGRDRAATLWTNSFEVRTCLMPHCWIDDWTMSGAEE